MNEKEVLEGNKLIAEFMGVEFNENKDKCNHPLIKAPWPPIECLNYNSSWLWIMPVVEYIESIKNIHIKIDYKSCYIFKFKDIIISNNCNSKIESIFKSIIEFIKWYNQNKLNETN